MTKVTDEMKATLNELYRELEFQRIRVINALFHRVFELESGWYNGHYNRDENGEWIRDDYPIPVVSVKYFCDVEIYFDKIVVSSKLKRARALEYSYQKLQEYHFEAYGVEGYLDDFYRPWQNVQDMKGKIKKSKEKEIGFSFFLPLDIGEDDLYRFVKLLRREGFYY